jgi:hypothetical protein
MTYLLLIAGQVKLAYVLVCYSFHLKNREFKIIKWHVQVLTKKKYCSRDINCISVLKHQTTDWSLLPTNHIPFSYFAFFYYI